MNFLISSRILSVLHSSDQTEQDDNDEEDTEPEKPNSHKDDNQRPDEDTSNTAVTDDDKNEPKKEVYKEPIIFSRYELKLITFCVWWLVVTGTSKRNLTGRES